MPIRLRHLGVLFLAALMAASVSCAGSIESDAGVGAHGQRPKPRSIRPGPLRFLIGAWSQPSYSFATWRRRGVNTMIGFESLGGTVRFPEWRQELERQGLYAIRPPRKELAGDARDSRLLAWMHADEPDIDDKDVEPAKLVAAYRRWKRAAPRVPVFVNFCGPCVMGPSHSRGRYRAWIKAADWIGNDFYPVTGRSHPDWIDLSASGSPPPRVGLVLDRLVDWSRRKPQIQIVESSKQTSGARAARRSELRGMIWHAVIHGATGIAYFPQSFSGGFKFDAAPAGLVGEMKRNNRLLSRLGPMLLSRGRQESVERPFEKAVRFRGGRRYELLLNLSHKPTRLAGRRFAPYELRVSASPLGRRARSGQPSRRQTTTIR